MTNRAFRAVIARRQARFRASGPQLAYLTRLLHEAFAHGCSSVFDVHHLERVTRVEASAEIERLIGLKKADWPRAAADTKDVP